jgi:hypothetical protein
LRVYCINEDFTPGEEVNQLCHVTLASSSPSARHLDNRLAILQPAATKAPTKAEDPGI